MLRPLNELLQDLNDLLVILQNCQVRGVPIRPEMHEYILELVDEVEQHREQDEGLCA